MKTLQSFGFLAVALVGLMAHGPIAAAQPVAYEGYGSVTTGGAGGDVYHVTSLADSGPGTLRDGVTNRLCRRLLGRLASGSGTSCHGDAATAAGGPSCGLSSR